MFGLVFGSLSTMAQTGFIIGMGLLIDTFVVRTVTVPAMAALVGKANWWPSKNWDHTDYYTTDATDSTDTEVAPRAAEPTAQAVAEGFPGDCSHRLATNNIRRSAARRGRQSLSAVNEFVDCRSQARDTRTKPAMRCSSQRTRWPVVVRGELLLGSSSGAVTQSDRDLSGGGQCGQIPLGRCP